MHALKKGLSAILYQILTGPCRYRDPNYRGSATFCQNANSAFQPKKKKNRDSSVPRPQNNWHRSKHNRRCFCCCCLMASRRGLESPKEASAMVLAMPEGQAGPNCLRMKDLRTPGSLLPRRICLDGLKVRLLQPAALGHPQTLVHAKVRG